MPSHISKIFLVCCVACFSFSKPALGAGTQQVQMSPQNPHDLQSQDTFESFKTRRALKNTQLRQQIVQTQPIFSNVKTDLGKAVVDRKVMIARQQEFLANELQKGVDKLYQKAVKEYDQKQFAASQRDFTEVERLVANFRETRDYLEKLKAFITAGKDALVNVQGDQK